MVEISPFVYDIIVYSGTVLLIWDRSKNQFIRLLFSDQDDFNVTPQRICEFQVELSLFYCGLRLILVYPYPQQKGLT